MRARPPTSLYVPNELGHLAGSTTPSLKSSTRVEMSAMLHPSWEGRSGGAGGAVEVRDGCCYIAAVRGDREVVLRQRDQVRVGTRGGVGVVADDDRGDRVAGGASPDDVGCVDGDTVVGVVDGHRHAGQRLAAHSRLLVARAGEERCEVVVVAHGGVG